MDKYNLITAQRIEPKDTEPTNIKEDLPVLLYEHNDDLYYPART